MSNESQAIYETGVVRPIDPVNLPEKCEVEFNVRDIPSESQPQDLGPMYDILSKRFRFGESDVAEKHNEHQP